MGYFYQNKQEKKKKLRVINLSDSRANSWRRTVGKLNGLKVGTVRLHKRMRMIGFRRECWQVSNVHRRGLIHCPLALLKNNRISPSSLYHSASNIPFKRISSLRDFQFTASLLPLSGLIKLSPTSALSPSYFQLSSPAPGIFNTVFQYRLSPLDKHASRKVKFHSRITNISTH